MLIFLSLYHLVWWNLVVGRGAPGRGPGARAVDEPVQPPVQRGALRLRHAARASTGLRYSIEDYVRKPGRQVAVKAVAYTLLLSVMAWGVFALLTFDPTIQAR
jgi:hypothetical protein